MTLDFPAAASSHSRTSARTLPRDQCGVDQGVDGGVMISNWINEAAKELASHFSFGRGRDSYVTDEQRKNIVDYYTTIIAKHCPNVPIHMVDGIAHSVPWFPDHSTVGRMEALGRAGVTVSIACGPCGSAPFGWSVHAILLPGKEFALPFAANSFEHAVEIVEIEAKKRGWL